jgi:hypothetical protein
VFSIWHKWEKLQEDFVALKNDADEYKINLNIRTVINDVNAAVANYKDRFKDNPKHFKMLVDNSEIQR